jgi:regulator of protease activity HflC (stomatin/prohibitin superfamily)
LEEGLHLKAPFVQTVKQMNNRTQKAEASGTASSNDLQIVSYVVAVNYRVNNSSSASLYKNVGMDYENVVLVPAIQESIKAVSAQYTAEQLITQRQTVGDDIKAALSEKINSYGITVEIFNIVNFDFSAEFNTAIEAKQVAEQNLLKTKTEQEQAITISEAQAKQKVIAAEANANAILKEAEAQAEANRLLEASLSDKVIAYEQITKWNGEMPKVVSGDSNGMLINIDPEDLGKSSSYVPPTQPTTQNDTTE